MIFNELSLNLSLNKVKQFTKYIRKMLIRTYDNKLLDIRRSEYSNDTEYYCDLVYYLYNVRFSKENNSIDKMTSLIRKNNVTIY